MSTVYFSNYPKSPLNTLLVLFRGCKAVDDSGEAGVLLIQTCLDIIKSTSPFLVAAVGCDGFLLVKADTSSSINLCSQNSCIRVHS